MANYKGHFQQRHGTYADFESHKTELLRAEMAIVESGDPNTTEGAAVYFKPGNSEPVRLANASDIPTYFDITVPDEIAENWESLSRDYAPKYLPIALVSGDLWYCSSSGYDPFEQKTYYEWIKIQDVE